MEHWKRKQMRLNYRWDLTGFEEEEVSGFVPAIPTPHPCPQPVASWGLTGEPEIAGSARVCDLEAPVDVPRLPALTPSRPGRILFACSQAWLGRPLPQSPGSVAPARIPWGWWEGLKRKAAPPHSCSTGRSFIVWPHDHDFLL